MQSNKEGARRLGSNGLFGMPFGMRLACDAQQQVANANKVAGQEVAGHAEVARREAAGLQSTFKAASLPVPHQARSVLASAAASVPSGLLAGSVLSKGMETRRSLLQSLLHVMRAHARRMTTRISELIMR